MICKELHKCDPEVFEAIEKRSSKTKKTVLN